MPTPTRRRELFVAWLYDAGEGGGPGGRVTATCSEALESMTSCPAFNIIAAP